MPRRIGKRVQIPRCRATVSEDIATGHWSVGSGKARGKNGLWVVNAGDGARDTQALSLLASQETGANFNHQPLSRVKEECMTSRWLAVILFSISASASDLSVKVVDPQSAAVSGAQVELFAENSSRPAAVQHTSAQGTAHFRDVPSVALSVHVLAPVFAEGCQAVT